MAQELVESREVISSEDYGVRTDLRSIVKSDDDIFMLLEDDQGEYIQIGDDFIFNEPIDASQALNSDKFGQTILAKFNSNSKLDLFVKFKNLDVLTSSISLINENIYLLVNTENRKRLFINNELFEFENNEYSAVFKFDKLLNLIDFKVFDFQLSQLKEKNNQVFGVANLNNFTSNKIEIDNFFLEAFGYQNENSEMVYVGNTPVVLQFDEITMNPILGYRMGSTSISLISDFQIDEYGSVVLIGQTNSIDWITFNDADTLKVSIPSGENFIAKYSIDGELEFAYLTEFNNTERLRSIEISEDGIYVSGEFKDENLVWDDFEIDNTFDGESGIGFRKGFVAKLDHDGDLEWLYGLSGSLASSSIQCMTIGDTVLNLTTWLSDGQIDIDGNLIDLSENHMSSLILNLDKSSGKLVSFANIDGASDEVLVFYFDVQSGVMIFSLRNRQEILDQDYGRNGYNDFYINRTSRDVYETVISTSVNESESYSYSVFPNPVIDELYFKSNNKSIDSVRIINMKGEVIFSRNYDSQLMDFAINFSDYPSGFYVLEYVEGGEFYKEKIIKI